MFFRGIPAEIQLLNPRNIANLQQISYMESYAGNQDNKNKTTRIGQAEHNSQDRTADTE
jgi:hypothetical protein